MPQPAVSRILSAFARLRERRRDDHSSRPGIADGLKRPTRKLRTGRPLVRRRPYAATGETSLPYLVLLRAGFCLPSALQQTRCALTAPFHPYRAIRSPGYPASVRRGGIFSVPLVLQVTLTGRYPAHCPAEFGLSSSPSRLAATPARHQSGRLRHSHSNFGLATPLIPNP